MFGDREVNFIDINTRPEQTEKEIIDTFSINAKYSDPFLRNQLAQRNKSENKNSEKTSTQKVQKPKQEERILWPNVIYKGLVENSNEASSSALIIVNGLNHIISKGEIIQGMELIFLNSDSIQLKMQNSTKTVKRHEKK